jgi:hypothetical protein
MAASPRSMCEGRVRQGDGYNEKCCAANEKREGTYLSLWEWDCTAFTGMLSAAGVRISTGDRDAGWTTCTSNDCGACLNEDVYMKGYAQRHCGMVCVLQYQALTIAA